MRRRVKLRAISSKSRSISFKPSDTLTRQNGVRIITMINTMVPWEGPNQMMARMAQPTDGNELRSGLIRSWTITSVTGSQRGKKASKEPAKTAISTAIITRIVLVNT